jgi:hypothetical protein
MVRKKTYLDILGKGCLDTFECDHLKKKKKKIGNCPSRVRNSRRNVVFVIKHFFSHAG